MNSRHLTLCSVAMVLALGCHAEESTMPAQQSPVTYDNIRSGDELTSVLESRWPLSSVTTFCTPERRHNPAYQNLVVDTDESWQGEIHGDENANFDKISWYSTVVDGKLGTYSLNAQLGDDWWLLEIGNANTLNSPPDISPDSSRLNFMGPNQK